MANEQVKKFISKILPQDVGGLPRQVKCVLGNGVTVVGDLSAYSEEIVERLALHGLSQKLGDSVTSFSKARDFHGAFGALQGVEDNLRAGVWSNRAGGGTADLVAAIALLQGIEVEDAQALVDRMDEEQLASIKKHPAIKAKVAELVAERAKEAAKADDGSLGELLAGIGLKG